MSGTAIYPAQSPDPPGRKEKYFMKMPDQPVLDKVRQWLVHADEDMRLTTAAMRRATGFTHLPIVGMKRIFFCHSA